MQDDLQSLLERLEAAEGPSRKLDAEIAYWKAGRPTDQYVMEDRPGRIYHLGCGSESGSSYEVRSYTSSIDAALTLVPEGWHGFIGIGPGNEHATLWWKGDGYHAAPQIEIESTRAPTAIALCIAALRARKETG